jgi:hypothetical protein
MNASAGWLPSSQRNRPVKHILLAGWLAGPCTNKGPGTSWSPQALTLGPVCSLGGCEREASLPGVEGSGGGAFALAKVGDGQAAVGLAFDAPLPELGEGGVGLAATTAGRHGGYSEVGRLPTNLTYLSRT